MAACSDWSLMPGTIIRQSQKIIELYHGRGFSIEGKQSQVAPEIG
jgi:hypothetical protein